MNMKVLLAGGALLLVSTQPLRAEEPFKAEKANNTWYQIENVNFKPGSFDQAHDIIVKHLIPATKAAGTTGPVLALVHATGPYDLTLIWKMDGGLSDMDWKTSPDGAKFMNALAAQEGGKDAALALWKSYMALIQDGDMILATSLDETPDESE